LKRQIAALEDRLRVDKAQFREQSAQVGHGHRFVATNVDATKEGDVRLHGSASSFAMDGAEVIT
jgi:hypothetical protein